MIFFLFSNKYNLAKKYSTKNDVLSEGLLFKFIICRLKHFSSTRIEELQNFDIHVIKCQLKNLKIDVSRPKILILCVNINLDILKNRGETFSRAEDL